MYARRYKDGWSTPYLIVMPMDQPYYGLRVIDLTHVIAGAYCSYLFAMLGADVIRVEPPGGDLLRQREGGSPDQPSPGFLAQAYGKRFIELDLKSETGKAKFLELISGADLLIENYRPGALASLGLAPDYLKSVNPRLTVVSINGYGAESAQGQWRAYDHTIQAASGLMAATGTEETGPIRAGPQVVDYMAGMTAAFAAAAALTARNASDGRGKSVVVPMIDCALAFSGAFATSLAFGGSVPKRRGNEAGSGSPLSLVAATKDGLIAIAATEAHQAEPLFKALDRADLMADPRFNSAANRKKNTQALRQEIQLTLATGTTQHWESLLNNAGVPTAKVRELDEALAFRQAIGSDFMTPTIGKQRGAVPAAPFLMEGLRPAPNVSSEPIATSTSLTWLNNHPIKD